MDQEAEVERKMNETHVKLQKEEGHQPETVEIPSEKEEEETHFYLSEEEFNDERMLHRLQEANTELDTAKASVD